MNGSEPIRRNARITPDAIAIQRNDGSSVTYATLDRTIDTLAHRLREIGLRAGQTTAIVTADGHRYLVVLLALARIGVTAAPGSLPPALTDVVLSDYPPGSVGHSRVVPLSDLWPAGLPAGAVPPAAMHADGSATLVLAPSSGTTTGAPKFVPISHDAMARRLASRIMHPPMLAGTRHSCFVGSFSLFGLNSVLRTLWTGLTAIEPNLVAEQLASWLVTSRVSHVSISPIGLRKLLDVLPAGGVACDVRTIEIGGGALPLSTYELAQQRLPATVIATFGSTETGPVATAPFAAVAGQPYAAGYVLPGVEVEVVDADDHPLRAGEEGILRVRTGGAAIGYRGNEAAAARVFRNGWVYPHDRAILASDGLLHVTGRTDDVIVMDGVKFNPQVVEEVLTSLADLREVAVFGVRDDNGVAVVCAAIVPNVPLDGDAFHARCRDRLGARAPALIMHLKELPRNAMGKVQRSELARMAVEADRMRAAARPS